MSETEKATKAPMHPIEIRIALGHEDWPGGLRRLKRLVDHIEKHGPECNQVSGGAGGCSGIWIQTRDISPEAYEAELHAWMYPLEESDMPVPKTQSPTQTS